MVEVNVSGVENFSEDDYALVNKEAEKTAKRNNFIQALDVKVHTHNTSGSRQKYSIHTTAQTDYGYYKAEASGWKLNVAIKDVLLKLERHMHNELKRKKGD